MWLNMRYFVARVIGLSVFSAAALASGGVTVTGQAGSGVFYGGSIGASFGDVDYIDVAPMLGVHLSREWSVGATLLYRQRNDRRQTPALSTNDYGASLFTRYRLSPQFFVQADYEYLDHEYFLPDLSTDREVFESVLGGGGMTTSLGGNVSSYLLLQYNFSYDAQTSPYTDPWSVRFGIGVGF